MWPYLENLTNILQLHVYKKLLLLSRTILAAIHFNFNLKWESRVDAHGEPKLKVTYPKFKDGEATVREMKVEQNYGNLKVAYMRLKKFQLKIVLYY